MCAERVPVIIVGAGPAGLMAAERLLALGFPVALYDAMPSVGRKFLLAGKGGLNLTHSEDNTAFLSRYGDSASFVQHWLAAFDAQALRDWTHALGVNTFVGSSGRVFPEEMKAAPLLRAWLQRLRKAGLVLHTRHRWVGWSETGELLFTVAGETRCVQGRATVFALGGASWARLGSDGAWVQHFAARHLSTVPFLPSNCGFTRPWSSHLIEGYAGAAMKTVAARVGLESPWRRGELMLCKSGMEGGLIYALSAALRQQLVEQGIATLYVDLLPDRTLEQVIALLTAPKGARSMASFLAQKLRLKGVKVALLRELVDKSVWTSPQALAQQIKQLPITFTGMADMDSAISTVGGVPKEALTPQLMLRTMPGVFCAGEMLDWDAPTGGYLLTACFASGVVAASGVANYLTAQS